MYCFLQNFCRSELLKFRIGKRERCLYNYGNISMPQEAFGAAKYANSSVFVHTGYIYVKSFSAFPFQSRTR